MANKKRRKRPRTTSEPAPAPATDAGRRARKEEARRARERARRQAARRARARRGIGLLVAGGLGLGVIWVLNSSTPPDRLEDAAQAAARAAGCRGPEAVLDEPPAGGQHLAPGESTTYQLRPATSGVHAPSPLPTEPNVFTEPVDETQAVHFMEHAGVILYYRPDVVGPDVVDRLGQVADAERNTLVAPYPDLPEGQDVAIATWNRLLTCPSDVSPDQVGRIARGFVDAFACTSVAPEPNASPEC